MNYMPAVSTPAATIPVSFAVPSGFLETEEGCSTYREAQLFGQGVFPSSTGAVSDTFAPAPADTYVCASLSTVATTPDGSVFRRIRIWFSARRCIFAGIGLLLLAAMVAALVGIGVCNIHMVEGVAVSIEALGTELQDLRAAYATVAIPHAFLVALLIWGAIRYLRMGMQPACTSEPLPNLGKTYRALLVPAILLAELGLGFALVSYLPMVEPSVLASRGSIEEVFLSWSAMLDYFFLVALVGLGAGMYGGVSQLGKGGDAWTVAIMTVAKTIAGVIVLVLMAVVVLIFVFIAAARNSNV